MFVVGLDVDTHFFEVSFNAATHFSIIWLYAGNFITAVHPPRAFLVGKIVPPRQQQVLATSSFAVNNQQVTLHSRQFSGRAAPTGENVPTDFNLCPPLKDHVTKRSAPGSDEAFGYYLSGLLAGGGCIGPRVIAITFQSDDLSVAYYIKKRLGFGRVQREPSTKSVRYLVYSPAARGVIYRLINGKLLDESQVLELQVAGYNKQFGLPISRSARFDLLSNH